MEPKKGYKTTEFWLSLAATLVGALLASGAVADGSVWAQGLGAISSVLGALGYTYVRGRTKAAHTAALVSKNSIDPR